MTVQSHVAVRTAADHQLALVVTSRAADQRIGFQYAKRVDDLAQAGRDVNRLVLFEVVEDPVEVLPDPGRQLDARQRYFASLRAAGRRTRPEEHTHELPPLMRIADAVIFFPTK